MKSKLFGLFLMLFSCATINAQDFIGYVKKADSTASPIFQAKVEITEGDKPFKSLKTYFDGSFKFLPNKKQTYSIKITYSGYTDTTYTINSDKNGKVAVPSVTVRLKKDGMRLMGVIKSREEDFPIKDATIVLKNVMTRQEDRITTDIDGRYNFKLEYETNYKVWLDKRSPGIFNLYKDTSFYVSTIGFNQPLDYKLDISLDKMPLPITPFREGYDTAKQHLNKNIKPTINVATNDEKSQTVPKKDTSTLSNNTLRKNDNEVVNKHNEKLKDTSATGPKAKKEPKQSKEKLEVTKQKEEEQKKPLDTVAVIITEKKGKSKKGKEKVDVVIINESKPSSLSKQPEPEEKNQPIGELELTRQKALAEKKAREIEAQIAHQKAEEARKLAAAKKRIQEEALAAEQKTKDDTLVKINPTNDSKIHEDIREQKNKTDSLAQANAERVKIAKELSAKQKATSDSILRVKDVTAQRTGGDTSNAQKRTFYLTKTQEELIAAAEIFARRKKYVEDSIAMVQEYQRKKDKELKLEK